MPATSFYADAASNTKKSRQALDTELTVDESELSLDDVHELEVAAIDGGNTNRRSTDLVRLYLQEIGRVRLLGRDEEVSEAQKVQRYLRMRNLLSQAAKQGDEVVTPFVKLMEVQERLTSELGHRPSLERWATTACVNLPDLKPILASGKRRWAEIAKLTVEELEQVQSQGLQAKEHMIKANLRLVVSVAKKYQNRGLELLDLVQEGTLGLERAVEKFDPTKGYRFSTYAYWWIRQGITRAIATSSRTIRLPVHITEKLNKIKKAQRKIAQEKGRTPTLEDLAIELEMTPVQVREVLLKVPRSVSMETKVGKDKDTELGELLETDSITPEETLMRESLQKDLHRLLSDLTSRERDVILMRFGLSDGHSYSLAEIGRALDLSRERVRQIESKALQKLRQPKRRNLIRDYLESLS
ncbi:RNA polymerase sigma factor SigC [Umezakia ovalisporum]|jgi:RNA polymerase nonessential primary-like sigma factor|uniref:RNA polymerase sigma factor n=2 Tax=Umezakia ovalisporum TaxID=75695 RepID=A0AA43GXF9_9CYAN|nr:RNA polymerase sigma factor SigC [Umezakia ovalisporum]MDH6057344.1 RNA polymerase sigma factor SigC [Umezakia ovalisporum FSS-43]MDH6063591.1 RNA polymerase sigma factor SigC [Umezakia ovalisporum FSS-62]MDH6065962.1 RNA polymerase sigma factor SigC [Umezakia ovalisporum APH033B]MDH6072516.1 RNA polymerase sigma factor SigC [Umezakia ovalisporum CobakiLakeA]MDH6075581.1 RNA polymerase sigma factor SigC [Umezakia ovalisporum CS-1034]